MIRLKQDDLSNIDTLGIYSSTQLDVIGKLRYLLERLFI